MIWSGGALAAKLANREGVMRWERTPLIKRQHIFTCVLTVALVTDIPTYG